MLLAYFESIRELPDHRLSKSGVMKVGDKIKLDFAGKKKDAVVFRLFPNSVHLKVDFEKDKGKIVKRKLSQVGNKKSGSVKEKKKSS